MKIKQSHPQHEAFYQELIALLKKHAGHLSAIEMLAISANMVGKIIAMQDQRTLTPSMAMDLVAKNIEDGNRQVLEELFKSRGSA